MIETNNSPRFLRGVVIARAGRVRQLRTDLWSVPSQSGTGSYLVDLAGERPVCVCADFEENGEAEGFRCKHVIAALVVARVIDAPADVVEMEAAAETAKRTYPQNWHAYERAQQHEREHFVTLLRDLCSGIEQPAQTRGRPRKLQSDLAFACVLRSYVGMSSRRAASDVRAAAASGLMDAHVAPKTLLRALDDESMTEVLRTLIRVSAAPLAGVEDRFAIDSTGIATSVYANWNENKYGKQRKRQTFLKIHACVGVSTHVITDALVTDSSGADCPQLPALIEGTAQRFSVREVSADRAYLAGYNLDAIDRVGATPYIPFKVNSTGQGSELMRRMFGLFVYRNAEFKQHYHARSNVESVFSAIKRKHGAFVRAKNLTAQINECLTKIVCHNISMLIMAMYDLGIAADFWRQPTTGVRHDH
jgi:transposase